MRKLIIHSLKDRKNWFLLNIVICVVIGIILPLVFRSSYSFFAYCSLTLSIILVIVSSYQGLTFLHDDRKLGYYLSKPLTLTKLININLITSIIFCIIMFICTFAITSVAGSLLSDKTYLSFIENNLCIIQIMFAWTVMLIFTITLSSILTGNTAVSVLSSMFIFAFPFIVMLLISYILNIISTTVVGMDPDLMMNLIVEKYFRVYRIYFFNYDSFDTISLWYVVRLVVTCSILYALILFAIKRRKNEKTGEFIVHSGYKYFMAIFASLIMPMFITMIMISTDLTTMIVCLVVLSILCYYILISIFNKSFRVSVNAIKIFVPFMIVLLIMIYSLTYIVNDKLSYIPQADDVSGVYIGNSTYFDAAYEPFESNKYNGANLINLKYDKIKDNKNILILNEKESIQNVIDLQSELIKRKDRTGSEVYIIYYLKNGKSVTRVYKIPNNVFSEDKLNKDDIPVYNSIFKLIASNEFIDKKFITLTHEEYLSRAQVKYVNLYSDEITDIKLYNFDYRKFAECYLKDYKNLINDARYKYLIAENIFYDNYDFNIDKYYDHSSDDNKLEDLGSYTLEINFYEDDEKLMYYIGFTVDYQNLYRYIESLINE